MRILPRVHVQNSSEILPDKGAQRDTSEPCHPPLGTTRGAAQHVYSQDAVIQSSKVLHIPRKSNLLFPGQKLNKQTKIQPPLWRCSKCPWGVKWGHVWSALPPTSVYHPVERGCLHGDVPPPLPALTRTGWKRSRVAGKAPFQTCWLMKSIAMTSTKCKKMGHSLKCQVHWK